MSAAASRQDILGSDKGDTGVVHADICTLKPALDLTSDYFAVFGLVPAWDIDPGVLASTYRSLQQLVHPDRFTRECDRTQRLAQQQAAMVNAAYQTLKTPLLRAQYLLELAGRQRAQDATLGDPEFLMQQMVLRERLDEAAGHLDELAALLNDVQAAQAQYQDDFSCAWQQQDWAIAQLAVDKLQFACKLRQEIDERQSRLLDD